MNNKTFPLFITLLLFVSRMVTAQTNPVLAQTLDNLQKQATDFPFEKVYLHMDKPYYGAGDTIWFKAYTVIGGRHYLSAKSSVLNVDLIDEDNVIRKSIKLPLVQGVAFGDLVLGDTTIAGNYRVRAYTNWMRNAGPEYFFDKTIAVVNSVSNRVFTKATYAYVTSNGQPGVNVTITYTDLEGNAYANREVKYDVQIGTKKIAKGKGVTDGKGILQFAFADDKPASGKIVTSILLDGQKSITKTIGLKSASSKIDVKFFPESGQLVNGLASKVAFKAVGPDGLGVAIKGTITDDQNNDLGAFQSGHLGMGTFVLAPLAGRLYKANITYADGSQNAITLPLAIDKGYVMAVDSHSDSLNVKVKIICNGYDGQNGAVTLVASSGGEVYLQGTGQPGKQIFTALIPKSKLPTGIVQFTCFDNAGNPVNERLAFIQKLDQLHLAVTAEKPAYSARQKVSLSLCAKDNDGKPVQGDFSVSVIDESKVPVDENTENSILANLLLTSDLRGYIEQPNYYFAHPTPETVADLDVLMLTQGYHRFEWKQVAAGAQPAAIYSAEKTIAIAGYLKTADGPVGKSKLVLINKATPILLDTITDKNGRFVFNLDFRDSTRFTIKTSDGAVTGAVIDLEDYRPDAGVNKNYADAKMNFADGLETYMQASKALSEQEVKDKVGDHTIVLKQVNVNVKRPKTEKELRIERAVEFSANLNGAGVADQVVTSDDLEGKGCPTVGICLAGKLLGITFSSGGGVAYSTRGNNSFGGRSKMYVVVDGIPGGNINDVNIDDIASIEVLRSGIYTAIYGSKGSPGVLVITSKHGNGFISGLKDGSGIIFPKGYYVSRQFYSPQYGDPKTDTRIADLRPTIFWKPILETDKNGNATFEYFNAGSKGTYKVVVEGIDYNGKLGRQVYRYKVE